MAGGGITRAACLLAALLLSGTSDAGGGSAATGTLALVIRALGLAGNQVDAHALAREWWQQRHQTTSMMEAV